MDWTQITVLTTTAGSDIVSAELIAAGCAGTMIEDRNDVIEYENAAPEGHWDILDENILRRMGEDVRVSGYFPTDARLRDTMIALRARLDMLRVFGDFGKLTVETGSVDDEDWAESWKKQYVPFHISPSIVIRPSWTSYTPTSDERVIELDPGMAFGTGTHETTALCAQLIEAYVKPGDRVVDVGTGTGILAICAALRGAETILATDIDPVAVRVAGENIRLNALDRRIETRCGDLLQVVDGVYDVAIANIIADVICQLAAPIADHIKSGGTLICSGIAREKQEKVRAALRDAGYTALDVRAMGEWVAIACKR